jgi:hypothetical protein
MRRGLRFYRHQGPFDLWVISVSVLFAVLGQGLIELGIHIFGGKTSSSETWLIGFTLIVLVIATGMLSSLYKSVAELKSRVGLSVSYYRLDPGLSSSERNHQAAELYSACSRVIESVLEEGSSRIYAVNSFVEIGGQVGDGYVEAESRRYLKTLERKLGLISYHRIIQLADYDLDRLPDGSIGDLIAPNYRDHYRAIVKADGTSTGRRAAIVDAVRAKYPISFVVAQNPQDGEFGGQLIWQMNEHLQRDAGHPDSVQLTGVFIVKDPEGVMIKTFIEWFEELKRAYPHRLTIRNLEVEVAVSRNGGEPSGDSPIHRAQRNEGS